MDADALFIKLRSDWQCVNGFCEKVVANVVKVMLLDFDAQKENLELKGVDAKIWMCLGACAVQFYFGNYRVIRCDFFCEGCGVKIQWLVADVKCVV